MHHLTKIAESLVYSYKQEESNSYNILDVLTVRLISFDIVGFTDTFCQYNENWLIPFLLIDLLYNSNLILPDCPSGQEFFYKRKQIGLEIIKAVSDKSENLAIMVEYLIAICHTNEEILAGLENLLSSKNFISKLSQLEKIKIFHFLLNHPKLDKKIAEKFGQNVGISYFEDSQEQDQTKNQETENLDLALSWKIRANSVAEIEQQLNLTCFENVESFAEVSEKCRAYWGGFRRNTCARAGF